MPYIFYLFYGWSMEKVLIFVDDGFFGLVKKHFQKQDNKPKKYLQTFRNICAKENLNLEHLFIYTAPPFQSPKPTQREDFLMSKYQNMTKMLRNKKWITLREGRCQRVLNEEGKFDYVGEPQENSTFQGGVAPRASKTRAPPQTTPFKVRRAHRVFDYQKGVDALVI